MIEEQKKSRSKIDLTIGEPLKVLLLFAIPLCIGQLFHLLYTLVDTRMVGQILGEEKLAAVGATTTVCDMLIGFINGVTNGFGIVVARFYGAKDEKGLKQANAMSSLYGIGVALLLSIICLVFLTQVLIFLNVPVSLKEDAGLYLEIMVAGLFTTALYNIGASSLRAIGDSFTPLLFLIISSLLNIALDYLFMAVLATGVAGAAIATVLAQGVSAISCLIYLRVRYPILRVRREDFTMDFALTKSLFGAGIGMGFMVSFVQMGTVVLQTAINTFDNAIIVAHTAARKATSLFMVPFSVLGSAMATYSGQNMGAREYKRIFEGMNKAVIVAWIWCGFVFVVNILFAPNVARLITATKQPEIYNTAARYLRINTALYFVTAVITVFRNTMQGFGDTKTPIFSSCLELVGKILIALLLAPAIGYFGIIISEPIVWVVMVIPLIVNMYRSEAFKISKRD